MSDDTLNDDSPRVDYCTTFVDDNGDSWQLKLDGPILQDIRDQYGIDLARLDRPQDWERLSEDIELQVNVLHAVLLDECQRREIDARSFAKALGPGDVREKAIHALLDAFELFLQPGRRSLWRASCDANRELLEKGMRQAVQKIRNPKLQEKMLRELGHRMDSELEKALTRSRSATDTRGSSGSARED